MAPLSLCGANANHANEAVTFSAVCRLNLCYAHSYTSIASFLSKKCLFFFHLFLLKLYSL